MGAIVGQGGYKRIASLLSAGVVLFLVSVYANSQDKTEDVVQTCLDCHNSPSMLAIFRTPHGQQADPNSPMASAQCEMCHGPGDRHADTRLAGGKRASIVTFGPDEAIPVSEQDAVCTECHQTDVTMGWIGSEHAQSDIGCGGCHSVHAPRDPVATRAGQNAVCYDCHRDQQADSMKPYTHLSEADSPVRVAAMVCTDCHNPHSSVASGLLAQDTSNDVCFECHAEYRGPVLFDHAPVSEDCSNCHQPHGSIHSSMLARSGPLLCQSCHSQSGHPSISFTNQSLPGGSSSPMVLGQNCMNCHTQVHGSNHPSGFNLMR